MMVVPCRWSAREPPIVRIWVLTGVGMIFAVHAPAGEAQTTASC